MSESQELILLKYNDGGNLIINGPNLDGKMFLCEYMKDVSYEIHIKNLNMTENSTIKFDVIYNNQDRISNNYLNKVIINDKDSNSLKFNNKSTEINGSHYILQNIKINRKPNDIYEAFIQIVKINIDMEYDSDISIVRIKKITNNESFYDIDASYSEYYKNVGEITNDTEKNDRNEIDVSFAKVEETDDMAEFEKFVINLYEEEGILVDTSGNEDDDEPDHFVSKDANDFKIKNLIKDKNYYVEIYPIITHSSSVNNNNYTFNFNKYLKINQVKITTNESIDTTQKLSDNINFIKYKYENKGENELLTIDKNLIKIEKDEIDEINNFTLTIKTLNVFKYFEISFNDLSKIKEVILLGDKIKEE